MNYLNRLLIGIGIEARGGVEPGTRKIKLETGGMRFVTGKISVLRADVTSGLVDGRAEVPKSVLEKVELLKQVDLLDSLVDCLELFWISFQIILWVATLCRRPW